MSKTHTCDELGVCQRIGCPDCDAFECELPCSPEPARPTFAFAPGTIEGPYRPPMTRRELLGSLLILLASAGLVGLLAAWLMEYFA